MVRVRLVVGVLVVVGLASHADAAREDTRTTIATSSPRPASGGRWRLLRSRGGRPKDDASKTFGTWERTKPYLDLGAQTNPRGRVRRVFYPLSGTDVGRVLASFSGPAGGPDELVLMDALPFGSPDDISAVVGNPARRGAYLAHQQEDHIWIEEFVRDVELAGAGLRFELERLGATDIQVTYLAPSGAPTAPPPTRRLGYGAEVARGRSAIGVDVMSRLMRARSFYDPAAPEAARIVFRLPGRARPVTLTYVQHDVRAAKLPEVLDRELARGVDAIYDKGSMLSTAVDGALLERSLTALDARHGVLVTDNAETIRTLPGRFAPTSVTTTEGAWGERTGLHVWARD